MTYDNWKTRSPDDYDRSADWFLLNEEDEDPPEDNPYQVIKLRNLYWVQHPDGDLEGPYVCRAGAQDHADECWEIGRP